MQTRIRSAIFVKILQFSNNCGAFVFRIYVFYGVLSFVCTKWYGTGECLLVTGHVANTKMTLITRHRFE